MKKIEDIKILVVGDMMIDKYTCGTVERISPEAPVPVVHVTNEYTTLGGSGNVISNLRSIGAQVDCFSSIGMDKYGGEIVEKLNDLNVGNYLQYWSWQTTVKERIVAGEKQTQLLRIDRETIDQVTFYPDFFPVGRDYDVIIISDYAKGFISKGLVDYIKYIYPDTKIIVDPKPKNFSMYSSDIFMITPNEKEYNEIPNIQNYLNNDIQYILKTKGKRGMTLYDKNTSWNIEGKPVEIFNVSGAGDTVISVIGVCLGLDLSPVMSCKIANECASYVVTKPGTTTIPKDILMKYLSIYINN